MVPDNLLASLELIDSHIPLFPTIESSTTNGIPSYLNLSHLQFPVMDQFISRSSFIFLLVVVIAKASQVHTIKAGFEGNFVFDPDTTTASVGDLVVFQFFPTNHSVVRGEYAQSESCGDAGCNPCVPYELIHPGQQGFNSGNVLTQTTSTDGNVLSMSIVLEVYLILW